MDILDERLASEIKNSSFFPEWRKYISQKILELNSIEGLDKLSNEAAGEEAKVREKTIAKLKEILVPFYDIPKVGITKAEAINKAKFKAGL